MVTEAGALGHGLKEAGIKDMTLTSAWVRTSVVHTVEQARP